jgi:ribonuclease R
MAAMAVHCSQRERRAEEAERDVDERFKTAWMSKHVGSEFDGVITGVTSFGLFVELEESRVSGLVHISQLANDYYHFDPVRKLLKGERTGEQFRLGDHVRVQVLRASLEDRKIDFRLVPRREQAPPPKAPRKAYDYGASGERYSLPRPTSGAPAAKPPGMFGRAARAVGRAFGRAAPAPEEAAVGAAMGDNRALRGKAKMVSEAAGRPAVPSGAGLPELRSRASKTASEAIGRPAIPPEFRAPARSDEARNDQARNDPARGDQAGNRKGNRAKNNPGGPGKSGGGKRKAPEAASAAAKRPDRQRKPKGKA